MSLITRDTVRIFVVNYNYYDYLETCLSSINRQKGLKRGEDFVIHLLENTKEENRVPLPNEVKVSVDEISYFNGLSLPRLLNCCGISSDYGFTVLISADDFMHEERLYKQRRVLTETGLDCSFVHSDISVVDNDGALIKDKRLVYSGDNLFRDYLNGRLSISSPSIMYRSDSLVECMPYEESLIVEDFDMISKLLQSGKCIHLPECLTYYRKHNGQFSRSLWTIMTLDRRKVYEKYPSLVESKTWDELRLDTFTVRCYEKGLKGLLYWLSGFREWCFRKKYWLAFKYILLS